MTTRIAGCQRRARKVYRCGMCTVRIGVSDLHQVDTYVFDGRVYNWRTCLACESDGITNAVSSWAGHPDEGVAAEAAIDWADELMGWKSYGYTTRQWSSRPAKAPERFAARSWLARAAGGEGE